MDNDLSNYRASYKKGELLLENAPHDPMELFRDWFVEIDTHCNEAETNAMSIATLGLDGFPKTRIVLLKKYTSEGFVFYTNYNSEKGKAIINNPKVCLSFFWPSAERQIIIKGNVKKVSEDISDTYFKSRPRGSQLGAIASNQSEVISNRAQLEDQLKTLESTYQNTDIQRPKHWGGFIVKPVEMEFWQGRANRLHDRIRYQQKNNNQWVVNRLAP